MANTKSIDLESSSSQYLSRASADLTGLDLDVFSIECWVKTESIGTRNGLVSRISGSSRRFGLSFTSTNLELYVYEDGGGETQIARSWTPSNGIWYHVAATYDSSGNAKLYINGSQIGTTYTGGPTTLRSVAADLNIGAIYGGNFLDGLIDEVIIWNDVRTDTEISNSYNSGNGKIYVGNESGMVGYWRMENDLTDETSNGNDLTNNNSATFSTDVPFTGTTAGFAFSQAVIIS